MLPSDSAQANAWRDFLNGLKTEPMTITELAGLFEISRIKMSSILDHTLGVEKLPGRTLHHPFCTSILYRQRTVR